MIFRLCCILLKLEPKREDKCAKQCSSIISIGLEACAIGMVSGILVILLILVFFFSLCFSWFPLCCPLPTYWKKYKHISILALGFPMMQLCISRRSVNSEMRSLVSNVRCFSFAKPI